MKKLLGVGVIAAVLTLFTLIAATAGFILKFGPILTLILMVLAILKIVAWSWVLWAAGIWVVSLVLILFVMLAGSAAGAR